MAVEVAALAEAVVAEPIPMDIEVDEPIAIAILEVIVGVVTS
jgi:hypothetical protein